MKVVKNITVRQLNKLAPFNDKNRYPNGITYVGGEIPTPGTWAATLLRQMEYFFGNSNDDDDENNPKPRKGNIVTFPK